MTVSQDSSLVGFDGDAALAAARETAGDAVRLVVEYTDESFRTLYADELTMALYRDEDDMREHFESVHDYVGIDFTELEMFEELFKAAGGTRALTTHMDNAVFVRIVLGEREGLFVSMDPGTDVTSVVGAVEDAVAESRSGDPE